MEKRTCLRQKCGVEFTPTKPKQKYCSTKCRTYAYRESLKDEEEKVEEPKREVKKDKPKDTPVPPKNDPKEGSMAFHLKYGAFTYAEAEKLKNTQE